MADLLNEIRGEIDSIDRQMASLYEKRMGLMKDVAAFKKKYNKSVFDRKREEDVLKRNGQYIEDPALKPYYRDFMTYVMEQGKDLQSKIIEGKEDEE